MALQRRNEEEITEAVKDVEDGVAEMQIPIDNNTIMISTGSTLLDLTISGGRVRGGGIPSGIMVELSGPSGSGKTSVLVELAASVQDKGGDTLFEDPEARIDKEYSRIYGYDMEGEGYNRPDTVTEMFEDLGGWKPAREDVVNLFAADSIAALSTNMEMGDGDKRGQRKAKELSEGCRKTARLIAHNNKLVVFTNQERVGDYGPTTPGGLAIGYHCSLRIRIVQKKKIDKEKTISSGAKIKKIIGIHSDCTVIKSTVDDPFRSCPLYIIFGVGIDDVRANLQYVKDMMKYTKYWCGPDQDYVAMDKAIAYIEDKELEEVLREEVIEIWEEVEAAFHMERKKKVRFQTGDKNK